jgi:hypothetical protein
LVLYKLQSKEGLMAVKNMAVKDDDQEVRRMSTHIYNEYKTNNFDNKFSMGN